MNHSLLSFVTSLLWYTARIYSDKKKQANLKTKVKVGFHDPPGKHQIIKIDIPPHWRLFLKPNDDTRKLGEPSIEKQKNSQGFISE